MTYGTVGEGKSYVGQLFWLLFELIGLVAVCTYLSWAGSFIGWNVFEWGEGQFKGFLTLLVSGLIVYVLLVALSRQVLLLRHWREPLMEIHGDGLRMPWIFRGTLRWPDISGVETSGDAAEDDKQGAMEPHLVIRLKDGSNFEHQGLPRWRARSITLPVARPAELAALITSQPGYEGAR
jgi:hypothetical protein